MKNIWWFVGALTGMTLVFLIVLIQKLSGEKTGEYDERQVAARGVAYKYGFFAVIIYELFYGTLAAAGIQWVDAAFGALLGIFIGATVFGVTAIAKDAFISQRETPGKTTVTLALILAYNLLAGIHKLLRGEAIVDGMLTFEAVNLVCAAMFLIVGIAGLIHWLKQRGQREEERLD